jgi:hypothetical protein
MRKSPERFERKRKPFKCPDCGATEVAVILYGMPINNEKLQKDLQDGRIALGGCCLTGDDPRWECIRCRCKIHKKGD